MRWRRSRVVSPVEYIETRFNRATHTTLSILFAVSLLYWPMQHMASLGKMIGPLLSPVPQIGKVIYADIDESEKEMILGKNAAKLFGIEVMT